VVAFWLSWVGNGATISTDLFADPNVLTGFWRYKPSVCGPKKQNHRSLVLALLIALGLGGGGGFQTLWRYFISIPNRDLNTTTVTTLDIVTRSGAGACMTQMKTYNRTFHLGCLAFGAYVQFIPTTTQALRADNSGQELIKRWICQHPVTNLPPLCLKKNSCSCLGSPDHNCISGWRLLVVHQKIRF